MNNHEKIIGGDLLWRPTEAAKNLIFAVLLRHFGSQSDKMDLESCLRQFLEALF